MHTFASNQSCNTINTSLSFITYKILVLWLISMLYACGGGGGGNDGNNDDANNDNAGNDNGDNNNGGGTTTPPTKTVCTTVHIVNLAQNSKSGLSCTSKSTDKKITDCVEKEIKDAIPEACLGAFDVFVPGTNAEDGAWKNFNTLFLRDTSRAYLSLKYQDNIDDSWKYDQGVLDATESLKQLLFTLRNRFKDADVRVFGHSKGSHPVALVADDKDYSNMKFFAFAQPGRTNKNIDGSGGVAKGKLGSPGYIHKLSNNLVGITWKNDEVQYYKGIGTSGLTVPEKWGWPGFIFQGSTSGTYTKKSRIDHHDTYGGEYTNGLSENKTENGDGSTSTVYPYCATGNKKAWDNPLCDKESVKYFPWFWGDDKCRDTVFDIMANKPTGHKRYIGYSGPRASDCSDNFRSITVDYRLDYRIDLADQDDCRYDLKIQFQGLNHSGQPYTRPNGGTISVSHSRDTGWTYKEGTVRIPYHTRIYVTAKMVEIGTGIFGDCGHLTNASESYIKNLDIKFTHPGSKQKTSLVLIGLGEGSSYPWPAKVTGKQNSAWDKYNDPNDSKDTWDMFYASSSLMIKGDTDENRKGYFFKPLHLVD